MKKIRGIKATLLKKTRTAQIPSRVGVCESCNKEGQVRYFVAAKLPRHVYLCDENYLRVRDKLEKDLEKILQGENLL